MKDNTKQKLRLQTNDTTTYDGADAMRQLVHWAEYGDRRLTGCIVRHRRFADPKDPTVQKSSLGIVIPVKGGEGLLKVSYLSASDPNRARQVPITFAASMVPGMHKDCWTNITQTTIPSSILTQHLECLRCGRPRFGPYDGATCIKTNPCVYMAFSPIVMDLVSKVEQHPLYLSEVPVHHSKRRRIVRRKFYTNMARSEA